MYFVRLHELICADTIIVITRNWLQINSLLCTLIMQRASRYRLFCTYHKTFINIKRYQVLCVVNLVADHRYRCFVVLRMKRVTVTTVVVFFSFLLFKSIKTNKFVIRKSDDLSSQHFFDFKLEL